MAVRLRWANYADADVAEVRIYRRLAGGTDVMAIIASVTGSPPALTYLDNSATNGVSYAYRIDYVDDSGNQSIQSDKVVFTPTGSADTQAPTWPGGSALTSPGQDSDTIFLQWDSATDNVGVDYYEIWRRPGAGGTYVLKGLADFPNQSWAESGLTPNTSYQYLIYAFDAAGNQSTGLTVIVSTAADTTPPPDVTGLRVVAMTPTTAQLDWDNSTASDLMHYHLEKNSVNAGNVTTSNTTLTGLTANTGYIVSVKAVDTSNNGANPVGVSFTTPATGTTGNVFKFIDEYPDSIVPDGNGLCHLDPRWGVLAPDYSGEIMTFVRAHSGTPGAPNTLIFPSLSDMPAGFNQQGTGIGVQGQPSNPTFHCDHVVLIGGTSTSTHVHDVIIDGGGWTTARDAAKTTVNGQQSTHTGSVLRSYTSGWQGGPTTGLTATDTAYAVKCWPRKRSHFTFSHCHDVVLKHWEVYGPNVPGNMERGNKSYSVIGYWDPPTNSIEKRVYTCNALGGSGTEARTGGKCVNDGSHRGPYVGELEEQHAFAFLGDAWNVTVQDVEAHHVFGDGGTFYENHSCPEGSVTPLGSTVIKRFNVHHLGRMGFSPVGCQNITIKDGDIDENPRGAIDLEPPGDNIIRNIEISNINFRKHLLLTIPMGGGRGRVTGGKCAMDNIRILNNTSWNKNFNVYGRYQRPGANFGSNYRAWAMPRGRITITGNKSHARANDGAYSVELHGYWGVTIKDNWFPSNYSGGDQNDYGQRKTDSFYLTACKVYNANGTAYQNPINAGQGVPPPAIDATYGGGTDGSTQSSIQKGTGPVTADRGSIGARYPDQTYSGGSTGCFGTQSSSAYFDSHRDGVRNFLPCAEHLVWGELEPAGPGGQAWPPPNDDRDYPNPGDPPRPILYPDFLPPV